MVRTRRILSSTLVAQPDRLPRAAAATAMLMLLSTSLLLLLSTPALVSAYSGRNKAMIVPDPSNGWKAIEIVTEGDEIDIRVDNNINNNNRKWEIPDQMDGMGAFLVDPERNSDATLRLHVNHEDSDEATISEINLHKGRLKQAISQTVLLLSTTSSTYNNFVQSARVAYDRWSPDGGITWKFIGADITDPKGAGGFCRFCSSQYYPPNAFGNDHGFRDAIYITGEECWDNGGRLFALDVNSNYNTRDLYQVSGVTESMPVAPTSTFQQQEQQAGHGGMPFDSWENAAQIDTGESDHVALLLSADGGSETLRLYVGKKNTNANGNAETVDFLARNGLGYGRWFYLSVDFEWYSYGEDDGFWESTTPGRFVTNPRDAWSESKFEDIDTNPQKPNQVVLAESNSGVYVLDFDLVFGGSGSSTSSSTDNHFRVAESSFSVIMITSNDGQNQNLRYPDNVDWTRNNLIFVNKDNDRGGIWYMNPDGTDEVKVGETRDGGESTGILDVSELLNYPPASAMITTNQGSPSSMTLLLNPSLESFLSSGQEEEVVVPLPPTARPTATPVVVATPEPAPPPPPTKAPTKPPITPIVAEYDSTADCPISDKHGLFQIIQAEGAEFYYSAWIKTKSNNFCGVGYVDFDDIRDGHGGAFSSSTSGGSASGLSSSYGKYPVYSKKDGILQNNGGDVGVGVDRDRGKHHQSVFSSRQGNSPTTITTSTDVGISFRVEISFSGIYKVSFRYANGGVLNSGRPGLFLVDGQYYHDDNKNDNDNKNDYEFEFAATFGWSIWSVESKTVAFETEGIHTLDLFWTEFKSRPNIDWLSIELLGNY